MKEISITNDSGRTQNIKMRPDDESMELKQDEELALSVEDYAGIVITKKGITIYSNAWDVIREPNR